MLSGRYLREVWLARLTKRICDFAVTSANTGSRGAAEGAAPSDQSAAARLSAINVNEAVRFIKVGSLVSYTIAGESGIVRISRLQTPRLRSSEFERELSRNKGFILVARSHAAAQPARDSGPGGCL